MEKPVAREVRWVKPNEGPVNLYCNFVSVSWTLVDVSVAAGRIIQQFAPIKPGAPLEVEEQGIITMSWFSAKAMRDQLSQVIASYEQANGEIKAPTLAAAPTGMPDTGTGGQYKN